MLHKFMTFVVVVVTLAAIITPAFAEEKYEGRIVHGDPGMLEAARRGEAQVVCTDDKDLYPFYIALQFQIRRFPSHPWSAVEQVWQRARKRYQNPVVWITRPDDMNIPDGRVKAICVAFGEPNPSARDARVQFPANSRRIPVSAEPVPLPPSTPADPEVRESDQYAPARDPASPLAHWNSALAELRSIARHVAANRNVSRTDRAIMKDGLQGIRDILESGSESDDQEATIQSSSESWNAALAELRAAATDIVKLELSKSTRSAMKADLKDVEDALNKRSKKKFGVF